VTLPSVPDDPVVSVLLLIILATVGLLVGVVRALIKGDLVTGRERDYWRDFAFEEQRQKRELLVTGQGQLEFLRALPDADRSGVAGSQP
jgi:hypothetical protein